MAEAARDLALRLAAGDRSQGWGVAEVAMQGPEDGPAQVDLGVLEALARQVVEAVLGLEGTRASPQALAEVVRGAARRHLASRPGLARALAARLEAEAPRLLNLPRLARLAGEGLEVAPVALSALEKPSPEPPPEIVGGRSPEFARVLEDLELVADTELPVLLEGETGTGKELLARRLHHLSPRRQGPFIAVNCAGLAKNLLESELFGHLKGAFTGAATDKPGYLRAAQGGTLFLDEIGETTPEFQVRLLRVLEDRVVVPVGSHEGREVDFRLVCASHRDLAQAVERGEFNQALYYRIAVVPLRLPSLRRRREDLPELLDHFLAQACLLAKRTRRLAPETRRLLMAYPWPGNLRQLGNLIQRLVALSRDYQIGPELLPDEIRGSAGSGGDGLLRRLEEVAGIPAARRRELAEALAAARGGELANKDLRARLGCSDSTAKNLLRALAAAGLLEVVGERGGRRYRVTIPEEE